MGTGRKERGVMEQDGRDGGGCLGRRLFRSVRVEEGVVNCMGRGEEGEGG